MHCALGAVDFASEQASQAVDPQVSADCTVPCWKRIIKRKWAFQHLHAFTPCEGKRAWRHVSKWTWSLISLFQVSTDRHRATCSLFSATLADTILRVMLGCIALLRLKRQNQFLQLPGVEDVIMKMLYFNGFFSTLHVAMNFLVHFYLYMEYTSRPACLIALLWIRCYVPLFYLNRSLPFNKPVTGAMTNC